MRFVSIDLEMSGCNSDEHDLLEFGAIIDNLAAPKPLKDLPKFHCYFVKEHYSGEAGALAMHPHIFQRIDKRDPKFTYMNAMKFGNKFRQWLVLNGYSEQSGKCVINVAGKNFSNMDTSFLKNKSDFFKHVRIRTCLIDPAILFWKMGDESIPGLELCKKRAHIYDGVSHNALDDAMDVIKLLRYKLVDGKGH